ncbi:MAG TPA: alanine racemase C-terminal domain-containing protein, partial [Candidatus Limnocylindrales bacterium]|nr:alanine racemase C-terminal domain-containing protein [Candidatus Limnocylindrales bacterium]
GWKRAYAPGSWAVTRGVRVPLVGRVSSDALALDVTHVPGFGPDDEILLIGSPASSDRATDGAGTGPAAAAPMTVHDLAALRGSIAWEVLDDLTPRLSRVYVEGGQVVGVRYLDGVTRWVGD